MDVQSVVFANGTAVDMYCFLSPGARFESNVLYSFNCNDSQGQNWIFNDGDTQVKVAGTNFCLDAFSGIKCSA
jgi:hypothetical protein